MSFFTESRAARIKVIAAKRHISLEAAENVLSEQGASAFGAMVSGLAKSQEPKERVYKIKRSLKGGRVAVPGWDGRKFSFGPVWCDLVKRGKGPALTDKEKVRAHATWLGVPDAKKRKFEEVLKALQSAL